MNLNNKIVICNDNDIYNTLPVANLYYDHPIIASEVTVLDNERDNITINYFNLFGLLGFIFVVFGSIILIMYLLITQ